MSTTNIYVLRLTGGKYYVGKSADVATRYQQHIAGRGSAWTRVYRPVAIDKIIANASPFDEDKITKEYMAAHGIDAVRGGAYVAIELDDLQREAITREIWGAHDLCTRCGRAGHFVNNCYASRDIDGNTITDNEVFVYECTTCNKQYENEYECEQHEKKCKPKQKRVVTCYRCGKRGHYAPDCYVRL